MNDRLFALKKSLRFLNTRIGKRFLALFLVLSLLPLATVGWFATESSETAIRRQTMAVLRATSDGAEAAMREFLGNVKEQVLDFAQDDRIRQIVEASNHSALATQPLLAQMNLPRLLVDPRSRIPEAQEVFVLATNGRVVASSTTDNIGALHDRATYFLRGQDSFYNGELEKDPHTGQITWIMSAPIRARANHRLLGVVAFRIDPACLTTLTTGRRVLAQGADTQSFRIGDTGETYIVNRDGLMLTESRYEPDSVLRVRVNTLPVRVALERGQEITSTYKDYRGIEVSGASVILRDSGWIMLTEIDFTQAFAPVEHLRRGLLAVTIGLGFVVVLLAWSSTRRIIQPIQMLHESDHALILGDEAATPVSEEGLPEDELGELVRRRNALVKAVFAYQQRLKQQTARLEDTLTELEHMCYSIIHDMRAPLRAIIGFGDLLRDKEGSRLEPESREYLERMQAASVRMDHLIRDVLNYGFILGRELPLHTVNPSELLQGIVNTYPEFQSPRAEIQVPAGLPAVRGNEAALTQCLANLLENAVRYVAPGRVPHVHITGEHIGNRVRISIEDNGVGIPPAFQERIFGLFERGRNSGDGTGVGLAIVRKAAERMGGRTGVISEPGRGSTFWIELQAANPGELTEPTSPGLIVLQTGSPHNLSAPAVNERQVH